MKKLVLVVCLSFIALSANALSMRDLFNALKKQPVTKVDKLMLKSSKYAEKKAVSSFYPKIYGLASYEHFNSPASLLPVTPTESAQITKTGGSFPFSTTIKQLGLEVSVPVFVYPLFSLTKKAQEMQKSAKEKMRLNLLRNEAVLVSLNAKLRYLELLKKAMEARKKSLESQLKTMEVSINIGRTPAVFALKIQNAINQLDIGMNQIENSRESVISSIETLTSIRLQHSIKMREVNSIKENGFLSLKPLEYALKAQSYDVKAKKGKLYPSFYLKGFVFRKFGTSYNTDSPILRNYGSIGLYMQIPIFDKTVWTDIQKSESDYLKTKYQLSQLKIELVSESNSLKKDIKLLTKSIKLAKLSVKNQKKLLKYAEVAFRTKRMTEEEYLRYEDALLSAQANLFDFEAKRWESLGKLAVIYGNNLEEIVK